VVSGVAGVARALSKRPDGRGYEIGPSQNQLQIDSKNTATPGETRNRTGSMIGPDAPARAVNYAQLTRVNTVLWFGI
jgi:hypothetical protein